MKPSLSLAARDAIVAACLSRPEWECAFRCTWDTAHQMVISATLVARGNAAAVPFLVTQYGRGDIALHTHPLGASLEPSPADLECAQTAARMGVGFGVVAPTGDDMHLILTPDALAPRITPAMRADAPRLRHWRLWRFLLSYLPP